MRKSFLINLKHCFMDQLAPTITYFLGVLLVFSFYELSSTKPVEILYPLSLALVVYLVYFIIALLKYIRFQNELIAMAEHQDVDVRTHSNMEESIKEQIFHIHSKYSGQIHEMEMKNQKESRFMSTWIHNMKTPVSVNNLIMQRHQLGQITTEELMIGMQQENGKLNDQLDMVLNMLRMKEFVKDYQPTTVNLSKCLLEVINGCQKQFIYSRIFPMVEKQERDFMVLSDAKWNNLVLQQIISNGIKYSKPEEGQESKTMDFTLKQVEDKVILTIQDYGKGIPEYDMPSIFEPFFTGDNGRNTKGSSGIGLYFCKEVCTMLGHELNVESYVGLGTTVTLTYLAKL